MNLLNRLLAPWRASNPEDPRVHGAGQKLLAAMAIAGLVTFANSQGISTSFKQEILLGQHQFGTATITSRTSLTSPTADTFKAALYLASGSQGTGTTAYSATNEVSGTNYTAGGVTVTWIAPTTSGTTAYTTPSASLSWSNVTLSTAFDAVTIYNSTQSNRAVGTWTFGSQTVTAGNFTLTMPTNDSSNALLRIS